MLVLSLQISHLYKKKEGFLLCLRSFHEPSYYKSYIVSSPHQKILHKWCTKFL
jgi:hypothetical protein